MEGAGDNEHNVVNHVTVCAVVHERPQGLVCLYNQQRLRTRARQTRQYFAFRHLAQPLAENMPCYRCQQPLLSMCANGPLSKQLELTFARILFQSSTSFSVQRSTMVVVCRGEASLARYGP